MQDDKQSGLSWSTPVRAVPAAPAPVETEPASSKTGEAPGLNFPSSRRSIATQAPVYAAVLVLGIIAGVLISSVIPASSERSQNQNTAAADVAQAATGAQPSVANAQKTTPTAAALVVEDQHAGPSVAIGSINIARPTWVVVYVSREGKPGNALGAQLFFAGDKKGTVGLLRNTQAGQSYFVGLSVDDGDRAFSLEKDKPVADADGGALWETFKAL